MILIFKHIKLLHLKHVISPKIPVNDQSVTDFNIVGNYRDLARIWKVGVTFDWMYFRINKTCGFLFLPDPGVSGVRSMGPVSLCHRTLVETLLM